jgi:hypothetical protein
LSCAPILTIIEKAYPNMADSRESWKNEEEEEEEELDEAVRRP